ncbi:hypothetical protein [Hyphomicrobium sp. MC1]|uniref:helix-turn-helix transcriptional regulator n=1 Tax=Hyphomicrobium sp. (strain MC1) TaxID=717785 RepID=UPI000213EDA6|nr:hypothetical protein [Hyphomicrobium sp. MC1]CCB66662.1 Regulatory protein LuxR (modular protein) [Hyphomicrobium sp. MC1]
MVGVGEAIEPSRKTGLLLGHLRSTRPQEAPANFRWLNDAKMIPGFAPRLPDDLNPRRNLSIDSVVHNAIGALGMCVIVVDSRLRILYASEASRALATQVSTGFSMARRGGAGEAYLSLASNANTIELRKLVAAVIAVESAGQRVQVSSRLHPLCSPQIICLISPIEERLADPLPELHFSHAALVIFKPFAAIPKPSPKLLRSLFSFTQAEAEVASDLVGGINADEVARLRNVRLDTIRSQIRSILAKSGAPNLRAFENRIGSLMAMLPLDATALR